MLHIVLWKWLQPGFREAYTHEHVNALAASIQKNMGGIGHRIVCVTDDPGGIDMTVDTFKLWGDYASMANVSGAHLPSCYRRLRIFDPKVQREMGIHEGDRVLSLDLDTLITSSLLPIVRRTERWVGWGVRGTRHPRVFNGSLFMFTARDWEELWTEFDPLTSPKKAFSAGFFGSDQGWLSFRLARRADCVGVTYPQIMSYPRELVRRPRLPPMCSIVFFHGKRKPWHVETQRETPWVKQFWRVPDAVQDQRRSA